MNKMMITFSLRCKSRKTDDVVADDDLGNCPHVILFIILCHVNIEFECVFFPDLSLVSLLSESSTKWKIKCKSPDIDVTVTFN